MQNKPFSIKKRLESFRYAFRGITTLLKHEHNARIHLAAAILAVAAGGWLGISANEWIAITICIGSVFALEAVNSAIERLADFVSPDFQELIGQAKDIAAGAVLFAAIAAAITGLIIFIPKILDLT